MILHVWHLQLILKTIHLTVLTNSKFKTNSNGWMDGFLSTSRIIQVRNNPLKHSSRIVRYINVCVCVASYQVVGQTASSELLLHSLLGTSPSSLSPCPPRSHLLLCSVLKETKQRKGFTGQVSSLNEPVFFFFFLSWWDYRTCKKEKDKETQMSEGASEGSLQTHTGH